MDDTELDRLQIQLAAARTPEEIGSIERLINGSRTTCIVKTLGEVATALNCSRETCKGWRLDTPPLPGSDGAWDLVAILLWRCERLKASKSTSKSHEREAAELRILKAEAEKKELAAADARGDLIHKSDGINVMFAMFNEARIGIEAIPGIIGNTIPPDLRANVVHEIKHQIELILRHLAAKANEITNVKSSNANN